MSRDVFTLAEKAKEADAVREALSQIQYAAQTIQTAVQRLKQVRQTWEADLQSGKLETGDLTALHARLQQAAMVLAELARLQV